MAEALPGKGIDQNIGVLDVGATSTRFYVFRNDEQIFMRARALWWQSADAGNPAAYKR